MTLSKKWATWLFVAGVVGSRIAMGLFFNVTGPTLPTLAKNVGVSVPTVSWIFTLRALASFSGAAVTTKIFKVLNPPILITCSVWGLAICLIVIPVITDFWLLCIMILIPGACSGFMNAGCQAIILEVWGPKKSQPIIQTFYFTYTVGAFFAPLIMNPFLAKANSGDCSTETACPGEESNGDTCDVDEDSNKYILYGFAVTCAFTGLVGVLWVLLTCWNVVDQIREDHEEISDTREEEEAKVIWPFLATFFFFFFNIETTEIIYSAYIYDYARCSKVAGDFESSSAAQLLTIFWGMMMVGRGAGILIIKKISPTIYSYIDLMLASIALILLAIQPITGEVLTYTATAIVGLGMSTVYGNGVLLSAKRTNMSDSYLWVYFFSAQLMTMMNPVLCSKLMEIDTENFVYMNLTTTILGLLTLPVVIRVYGYLRKKGVLKSPSPDNKVQNECNKVNESFTKEEKMEL